MTDQPPGQHAHLHADLHADLAPLAPVLGAWRTSGSVLDSGGQVTARITGSDTYTALPGGRWIAHEVDVDMGDGARTRAHELIGGRHPDGGWAMHAFADDDGPGLMRLSEQGPGLLLLEGPGVRSWLRPRAGEHHMTARWEREVGERWLVWMEMRFERG